MVLKSIWADAGAKIFLTEQSLHKVFTSKEDAMNVIEKTILFFRDQGLKGERFALTIERLGFDTVEEAILSSDELLDRKEEILSKEL